VVSFSPRKTVYTFRRAPTTFFFFSPEIPLNPAQDVFPFYLRADFRRSLPLMHPRPYDSLFLLPSSFPQSR